ncbi:cell division protein FtsQ/DivIB [Oceanobacillus halotolerans]|uniref:cell division protein FtsQ/DivIB n=1 Tax=Oceanobacillus halotolerans TaxID=2663380 RepID=UPI0013DD43BF|nr:FtsQ-type POTRA domain-containing protein [Oceanobacillus halotolerans]
MTQKKVVSIEEHIPTLKQERKKKANRRLIFYLSIFFLLISIIVYLQSPLSNVKQVVVTGNSFIEKENVIEESGISVGSNIWMTKISSIEDKIGDNPIVKSVNVTRKLPWTIEIDITEHKRVGYIKLDDSYHTILANGVTITATSLESTNGDAPFLFDFTEDTYLNKMTDELQKLPDGILNLISEIHWKPTESNKNKLLLYMNDGFLVDSTIRDFAEKMKVYPSIVSQLDSEQEGIIHIGVGVYFESFQEDHQSETEEIEVE